MRKERNRQVGKIITLRKGLSLYKVLQSRFYRVRIRDHINKTYIVRSTNEDTLTKARQVALSLSQTVFRDPTPTKAEQYRFSYFSVRLEEQVRIEVERGDKSKYFLRDLISCLHNQQSGLLHFFADRDTRTITTRDYIDYINETKKKRPDYSDAMLGKLTSTFRQVLNVALMDRVINSIPDTPKQTKATNKGRNYFLFYPLVSKENDEYKKIIDTARRFADEKTSIRGLRITSEFYDLIVFTTHSFVRPTVGELYNIKHRNVVINDDPKALILTLPRGKTGLRTTSTMPACVSIYDRILKRYPDHSSPDDYIFYPTITNRDSVKRNVQRQFNFILDALNLKTDSRTGKPQTVYSLRNTCLAMRLVLSDGETNQFLLAKNAGTSVEMLEQHYIKHLPPTTGTIRNIQKRKKN